MDKILTCNWYHYIDFENQHVIEMEFINHKNEQIVWKRYTGKTRPEVTAKAKREETRVTRKLISIYGRPCTTEHAEK